VYGEARRAAKCWCISGSPSELSVDKKLGKLLRGRKDTFAPAVSALRGERPGAPAVSTHLG